MGSLLDDIDSSTQSRGGKCLTCIFIDLAPMSEEDMADFCEALDNPLLHGTAIAGALERRGVKNAPSSWSIQRHRRGACHNEIQRRRNEA